MYGQQPRQPTYNTSSTCHLNQQYDWLVNPVGQIVEIGDRREIKHRLCTGFNIGSYFLTAGHCISTGYDQPVCYTYDVKSPLLQGRCVVNFGYEMCDLNVPDTRSQDTESLTDGQYSTIQRIVDQGHCNTGNYDYGVLQLSPDSGRFGSLKLSNESINIGKKVTLVHHPEGNPKQYSSGQVHHLNQGRFFHTAHTMGGSSGAPVVSNDSCKVIGVHVAGDGTTQRYNNAVPIKEIVETAFDNNQSWAKPYYKEFGLFTRARSNSRSTINLTEARTYNTNNTNNCCG